jgi:hypothetical protein
MRKYTFKILTAICILSLPYFLNSCNKKKDKNPENAENVGQKKINICEYGIFEDPHILNMRDFQTQSDEFLRNIQVYNDANSINEKFSSDQFVAVHKNSIKNTILNEFCQNGKLPAIIVYTGLTKESTGEYKIDYYLGQVYLEDDGSNKQLDIVGAEKFIADFNGPLYKMENSDISLINTTAERKKAEINCLRYRQSIRIKDANDAFQSFDRNKDVKFILIPNQIIESLINDNQSIDTFYFSSSCINKNAINYHSINVSPDSPVKARQILKDNNADLISRFRGVAANHSQLCPTKCGKLNYKLTPDPMDNDKRKIELID